MRDQVKQQRASNKQVVKENAAGTKHDHSFEKTTQIFNKAHLCAG